MKKVRINANTALLSLLATAAISGCGADASDSDADASDSVEVEEDIGSAAQPLSVGTATVRVKNDSNCDIDAVTVDHRYSDNYKNARVFSNIPRSQQSSDTLQVRYHYGAFTTGRDWWRVTWTCKGSTTRYFTDPNNFRSFFDATEAAGDSLLIVQDALKGKNDAILKLGELLMGDTHHLLDEASFEAALDEANLGFEDGLRLEEAQRERIKQDIYASIARQFARNSTVFGVAVDILSLGPLTFAKKSAIVLLDLSLNNAATEGYKQHILTSADSGRETVIRILPHGSVRFESPSGNSTTVVSTTHAYPEGMRESRGDDAACLSTDADLQGDYYCLRPNETLQNVGGELNDKFSSVLVSGGVAIACNDANFSGACNTFSRRHDNLGNLDPSLMSGGNTNDTISSIRYVYRNSAAWTPHAPWAAGEPNNVGDEDCAVLVGSSGRLNDLACTASARYLCSTGDPVKTFAVTTAQGPWSNGYAACAEEFPGYVFAPGVTHSEAPDARTALQNAGASFAWTSLNDIAQEGTFVTGPGLLPASAWNPGEPNDLGGEDCAMMLAGTTAGKLNDVSCGASFRFLCRNAGPGSAASTFAVTSAAGTWYEGPAKCAGEFPGYAFGAPSTEAERTAAASVVASAGTAVFVNLGDIGSEGIFESASTTYTTWYAGEPNDASGGEDCATVDSNGRMNDIPCELSRRYLCSLGPTNFYKVTAASGAWSNGPAACAQEFPGYIFARGINAGGAQAVQRTLIDAGNPTVWTSVNDMNQEGTFVF